MGDILIAIVCMPPASGVSATEIKSNMNKGPSFGNVRNGNRLKVSLKENLPERVQYSRSDGIAVIIGLLDESLFQGLDLHNAIFSVRFLLVGPGPRGAMHLLRTLSYNVIAEILGLEGAPNNGLIHLQNPFFCQMIEIMCR
ncbi:uncharacterized protein LOC109845956 [Asparagus officinalis]|uniref:uncharacterized protein LOC109845956 n=1 Tax=Asparagus officinalis TaxID=4686 RepID=UPI00098E82B6|nr:uncharacterized protein LOC109845956 [Asparagus officinalis]